MSASQPDRSPAPINDGVTAGDVMALREEEDKRASSDAVGGEQATNTTRNKEPKQSETGREGWELKNLRGLVAWPTGKLTPRMVAQDLQSYPPRRGHGAKLDEMRWRHCTKAAGQGLL